MDSYVEQLITRDALHLRQEQGRHEVDLLVELGAGRVLGIEVKAHAAPGADSARHLAWLRDELGDRFVAGVVLHTGPRVYALGEKIVAAPICTLWSGRHSRLGAWQSPSPTRLHRSS